MSVGDSRAATFSTWITVLLAIGGWVYQLGYQSARIDTIQAQVQKIDSTGSDLAKHAAQQSQTNQELMLREFSRFDSKLDVIERKIDQHMAAK